MRPPHLCVESGQVLSAIHPPAANAILDNVCIRAVFGSDETGMRLDGTNAWLCVVRTDDSANYTIAPTRGAAVLHQVMGTA